jgi:hypothetical protein
MAQQHSCVSQHVGSIMLVAGGFAPLRQSSNTHVGHTMHASAPLHQQYPTMLLTWPSERSPDPRPSLLPGAATPLLLLLLLLVAAAVVTDLGCWRHRSTSWGQPCSTCTSSSTSCSSAPRAQTRSCRVAQGPSGGGGGAAAGGSGAATPEGAAAAEVVR